MTPTLPVPGGCNCGQARYLLTKPPVTSYLCHCHLCQKRTGSPFSMSLVLPKGALAITGGETETVKRTLPSSGILAFLSCPICHSRLWSERSDREGMTLRAGTLDDTSWVRPVAQMWVSSAQPWAVAAGILSYEGQPTDYGPMLAAWKALS